VTGWWGYFVDGPLHSYVGLHLGGVSGGAIFLLVVNKCGFSALVCTYHQCRRCFFLFFFCSIGLYPDVTAEGTSCWMMARERHASLVLAGVMCRGDGSLF